MSLTVTQWRRAKNITQQAMADRLGVHVSTYLNWEKKPGQITIENAIKISEILEVPLNDIIFALPEEVSA